MNANPISLLAAVLILTASGLPAGCSPAPDATAPHEVGDAAEPRADAGPPDFAVVGINGGGSGCRAPGSFTSEVSQDGERVTIHFSDMKVSHEAGGSTLQTVACTVGVTLRVPQGWQLGVTVGDIRGDVRIPGEAIAKVMSSASFAGQPLQVSPSGELRGPQDMRYVFSGGGSAVESPCGQDAISNLNTRLVLDTSRSRDDTASMSMDTASLQMTWKKCE